MLSLKKITLGLISFTLIVHANAQTEPELVKLPAACVEVGSLLMGNHANPLREVCLDSFSIGRYEVTFREYDQFTEDTGRARRHDVGFGRENRPVIDVNWFDATAYAQWLSDKTGKQYRLPTDTEWEYAARANADFGYKYSWGAEPEENNANCRNCGSQWDGRMTSPVGSFDANAFGLYDMHGNVWEWTSDDSRENGAEDTDARGVLRGGSWNDQTDLMVFWHRTPYLREKPAQDIGFRLVLEH